MTTFSVQALSRHYLYIYVIYIAGLPARMRTCERGKGKEHARGRGLTAKEGFGCTEGY